MLNSLQNKLILFLGVCMSARIILALITKYIDKKYLESFGYLLLLPAMGFIIVYIGELREKGGINQIAWWNHLRPIHSFIIFYSSILCYKKR